MSGATSPGQQVCTGSRARSTSAPSHTTSWHGAGAALLRRHVEHLHEHRPRGLPGVLEALRRLGLLQEREQLADLAQRVAPVVAFDAHRARDALRRAEQVAEHRDRAAGRRAEVAFRLLEQQRGTAGLAARDRRARSSRASDRLGSATRFKLAARFELGEEVAEVGVGHGGDCTERTTTRPLECPAWHSRDVVPADRRFIATRRVVFGIVLASFVLSFFHRTAPAAIAGELDARVRDQRRDRSARSPRPTSTSTRCCRSRSACSPTRWARAGSWPADRWSPGAGSLAFALAPTWEIAAVGRTLVGIGVAVAFIAILKVSAVWFPGQPLRDAERRHDVRRQSRRRDRGRAAGVARHADVVAQRVRRRSPCCRSRSASRPGGACATGRRIWASRR